MAGRPLNNPVESVKRVMPTYGYRCPACGLEYEKFQKITDDTRAKCPSCGAPGERTISGGAGVHFKGSGFYETDYKRAGRAEDKTAPSSKKDSASKKKSDPGSRKSSKDES